MRLAVSVVSALSLLIVACGISPSSLLTEPTADASATLMPSPVEAGTPTMVPSPLPTPTPLTVLNLVPTATSIPLPRPATVAPVPTSTATSFTTPTVTARPTQTPTPTPTLPPPPTPTTFYKDVLIPTVTAVPTRGPPPTPSRPATLRVTPSGVSAGSTISAIGESFTPFSSITIVLDAITLGREPTDANGNALATIILPPNLGGGTYSIIATDTSGRTASVFLRVDNGTLCSSAPVPTPAVTPRPVATATPSPKLPTGISLIRSWPILTDMGGANSGVNLTLGTQGNLYVLHYVEIRPTRPTAGLISVFTTDGKPLCRIPDTELRGFPLAMAVAGDGSLLIAELVGQGYYLNRYSSTGRFLKSLPLLQARPKKITLDALGQIHVVTQDIRGMVVYTYDPNGVLLHTANLRDITGAPVLNADIGVSIDANGDTYVFQEQGLSKYSRDGTLLDRNLSWDWSKPPMAQWPSEARWTYQRVLSIALRNLRQITFMNWRCVAVLGRWCNSTQDGRHET